MACFFNNFVLYDFNNKLVENVAHGCYRLGSNEFPQGQIIGHCEVARETVRIRPQNSPTVLQFNLTQHRRTLSNSLSLF